MLNCMAVIIIPRVITPRLWKAKGSVEGIATASFFGAAALAGSIGLVSNSRSVCSRNGTINYQSI